MDVQRTIDVKTVDADDTGVTITHFEITRHRSTNKTKVAWCHSFAAYQLTFIALPTGSEQQQR
jgi:hypothetical protein